MSLLRILHFSDLLAGSSDFDRLKSVMLLPNNEFLKDINYIVISGNLTQAGETCQFDAASEFLKELIKLVGWRRAGGLSRLMIVPGPLDCHYTDGALPNFEAFKLFYDSLFEQEIRQGKLKHFNPEVAILREHKDVTFVGISCWNDDLDSFNKLCQSFRLAVDEHSQLEFSQNTPTLLVSADLISVDRGSLMQDGHGRLKTILKEDNFRIDFHLLGAGHVYRASPNPLLVPRICYGTGPKSSGKTWPLTVSVIRLPTIACLHEAVMSGWRTNTARKSRYDGGMQPGVDYYHRFNADSPNWTPESINDNEAMEVYLDKRPPPNWTPHPEGLRSIIERIHSGRAKILLRSFPGAGTQVIFSHLEYRTNETREGWRLHQLKWDDYAKWEEQVSQFRKVLKEEKLRKKIRGKANPRLVLVLHDFAYGLTQEMEQRQRMEKLQSESDLSIDDIINRFLEEARKVDEDAVIIYHIRTDAVGLNPGGSPGWKNGCFCNLNVYFHSTTNAFLWDMLHKFTYSAPINRNQVAHLTGNYAGFAVTLAQNAQQIFGDWDSGSMIDRLSSSRLCSHAIATQDVFDQVATFIRYMESWSGAKLCTFLQRQVTSQLGSNPQDLICKTAGPMAKVEFGTADLPRTASENELAEMLECLDRLVDYSVLEPAPPRGDEKRFLVKLLLPFWVYSGAKMSKGRKSERFTIFVSYGSKQGRPVTIENDPENDNINIILDAIVSYVQPSNKDFEIIYDHMIPFGEDFDDWIAKAIANCCGAILLVGKHSLNSKYVDLEMEYLLQRQTRVANQRREFRIIPILLESGCESEIKQKIYTAGPGSAHRFVLGSHEFANPKSSGGLQPWSKLDGESIKKMLEKIRDRLLTDVSKWRI